ncbi:MAG: hypothetical protein RL701_1622 [Pseudomonadota bacterium]
MPAKIVRSTSAEPSPEALQTHRRRTSSIAGSAGREAEQNAPSLRPTDSKRTTPQTQGYAPYLEGLRGLVASYVVLHHAALQTYSVGYDSSELSPAATLWLLLCSRGDLAVALFIVLSGYCLMLPVAATGQLRAGVLGFFRRRARRILPAYYLGLIGIIGLFWIVPGWNEFDGTHRDVALPALDGAVITSHLLLVHNFSAEWIWKLNGPLWSVAVEWQLYGLFPLLILVFRRFGATVGTTLGVGLGYALTALLLCVNAPLATRTCPWYLGLFAIGIGAAVRMQGLPTRPAPRLGWLSQAAGWLALAALVDTVFALVPNASALTQLGLNASMLIDPMIAQALVCVLFHCQSTKRSQLQAALEHPWLLRLGAFSYSLYLVHDPVLSFIARGLVARGLGEELRVWVTFLVAVPVATIYAYAFYCVAEKPFLPRRAAHNSSVRALPILAAAKLTHPVDRTATAIASTRGRELP